MDYFIIAAISWFIGCLVGGWAIHTEATSFWRNECIKRGYAQYNPKNGEWEWK